MTSSPAIASIMSDGAVNTVVTMTDTGIAALPALSLALTVTFSVESKA